MANIENNIWETGDGRKIPVSKMADKHIKSAFLNLCEREFRTFEQANEFLKKIDLLQRLKDMLEAEASKRNLKLIYPDEDKNNSREIRHYFASERKTKAIESKPVKPVLSVDDGAGTN